MKPTLENIKDAITILRELIVVAVIILLLLFPGVFNTILEQAGFTKGSLFGFNWEKSRQETRQAAQEVANANQQLKDLKLKVTTFQDQIAGHTGQPDQNLDALARDVTRLIQQTSLADQALKDSLKQQEDALMRAGKSEKSGSGWIYLGQVNLLKNAWNKGNPKTVSKADPLLPQGTVLTVIDDVYLREDAPDKQYAGAPVLSVVKVGEKVEVLEKDYSSSTSDGWYVWARVIRQ